MTTVAVNTYTTSVTYVAENMLKSLKDILVLSGLDPSRLTDDWETYSLGLRTYIESGHLERVILEVFDTASNAPVGRWDIDLVYGWSGGNGSFRVDTDQLRYALRKLGVIAANASYRVVLEHKSGAPDLPGWSDTTLRSTTGMVRQTLGGTIEHSGLGANTAYWRKS